MKKIHRDFLETPLGYNYRTLISGSSLQRTSCKGYNSSTSIIHLLIEAVRDMESKSKLPINPLITLIFWKILCLPYLKMLSKLHAVRKVPR